MSKDLKKYYFDHHLKKQKKTLKDKADSLDQQFRYYSLI